MKQCPCPGRWPTEKAFVALTTINFLQWILSLILVHLTATCHWKWIVFWAGDGYMEDRLLQQAWTFCCCPPTMLFVIQCLLPSGNSHWGDGDPGQPTNASLMSLKAGAQYLVQCLICKKCSVGIQFLEKFKYSTEITHILTTQIQIHLLLIFCPICMLMYTHFLPDSLCV